MSFRDILGRLSTRTEAQVIALWDRHQAGELDEDQFVRLAAAIIARSNARAVIAADISVAAALMGQLGQAVSPVGLVPTDEQPRLRGAISTVLAASVDYVDTEEQLTESQAARLGRLARSEPPNAGQSAMTEAMREQNVGGWVRGLSAKPCPICVEWADGVTRSTDVEMARHASCACVPVPVT